MDMPEELVEHIFKYDIETIKLSLVSKSYYNIYRWKNKYDSMLDNILLDPYIRKAKRNDRMKLRKLTATQAINFGVCPFEALVMRELTTLEQLDAYFRWLEKKTPRAELWTILHDSVWRIVYNSIGNSKLADEFFEQRKDFVCCIMYPRTMEPLDDVE